MVAAGILTLTYGRTPTTGPGSPGVPMVEEAVLLRCLTPGEAAELIRPLLRLPENRIVASPEDAPRVLTVRGTPAQLQQVKSKLDELQDAGSPACAPRPTGRTVS
jgi:hypothetical protein